MRKLFIALFILFSTQIAQAAITFNAYNDLDTYTNPYIYYYKAATAVTVNRGASNTAFDYFDNDFGVNDWLSFEAYHYPGVPDFCSIKLNIGTAIAATSYTGKWQYYRISSGAWTDFPASCQLVDNTSNFSLTGIRYVTWFWTTDTSAYGSKVRYLITAVTTPTEGGAQQTEKVEVGDNAIQCDATATPVAIYNAAVAGSWPVFTKVITNTGLSSYLCYSNLAVPSGAVLTIQKSVITMYRLNQDTGNYFFVRSGGTLVLGALHASGYSYAGGTIIADKDSLTRSNGSLFFRNYGTVTGDFSAFLEGSDDIQFNYYSGSSTTWRKMLLSYGSALNFSSTNPTYSNTFINNTLNWGAIEVNLGTITDLNVGWVDGKMHRRYGGNTATWVDCYLRFNNKEWWCDSTGHDLFRNGYIYQISGFLYGSTSGAFKRQFSFDLKVVDVDGNAVSGATVTLTDSTLANQVNTTTAAGGTITQQWVNLWMAYASPDTQAAPRTTYSPFTLTVSKTGYRTYVVPQFTPLMDNNGDGTKFKGVNWTIELAAGDTVIYDSTIYDSTIY